MDDLTLAEREEIDRKFAGSKVPRAAEPAGQADFASFRASVSTDVSQAAGARAALTKTAPAGGLPKNASEVFKRFRAELLKKWPDARPPLYATKKDLKRVKDDVLNRPMADVVEMIKLLVLDWEAVRMVGFPKATDQAMPTFEYLWRYAGKLSAAIGTGFTNWNDRCSDYAGQVGEGYKPSYIGPDGRVDVEAVFG